MKLANNKVVVVGLGRTGLATARFLHQKGARVLVADTADESQLGDSIRMLREMGVALGADFLVTPERAAGVYPGHQPVQALRIRLHVVVAALELPQQRRPAAAQCVRRVVALRRIPSVGELPGDRETEVAVGIHRPTVAG